MTINDKCGIDKSSGLRHNSRMSETSAANPSTMPIAIVGMSCRFPGDATDPNKLWDLCQSGRDAWSKIPESRFNGEAWYHPDRDHVGTSFVKGGYFLSEDISKFDASFFNLPGEIAGTMDPEVRMQLECVYEALENAGMTMEEVSGSNTAVCAGTCFRDFHDSQLRDPTTLARFYLTGNGMAMISNRVSHFYNLKGPSIAVDTGCSTTLTLLHLACQSLRSGETEMAVVGGSNALINPDMFISGTILGLLSAEGKCFSFDSRASGYGRGEGAATLILKPLEAAIRDGNPIRAVIRETAANQDGKTPTLTSPSSEAQVELINTCYARAGLDPRDTGYVECHGTGTQAGDTSEARAIGTVLGVRRDRSDPIPIGSVKTNIGHTEATSGLASVIKTVMALEKLQIPPSINFDQPNPNIPFSDLGIKIPTACQEWPSSSKLRASVNNFGYGGSNAHVIIEHPDYLVQYYKANIRSSKPEPLGENNPKRLRILKLGAKDAKSVATQLANLRKYVECRVNHLYFGNTEESLLDDLVYTFGQKRSKFPWTIAVPFSTASELALEDVKPQKAPRSEGPRIGYVFSGQGAQWYAMGRELIVEYPVFRNSLKEAEAHLRDLGATWSLLHEMTQDEKSSRIDQVIISLPASVAIQLALVRLLQSWGIEPTGVTGHSSGEVAAAFAVGVINMKEALAIVYTRGSLTTAFQQVIDRRGGMIAAGLSRDEAQPYMDALTRGKVVVACVNSPKSVTISGDLPAIEELEAILVKANIFARRLRVDAAYHSHHMLGIAEAYHDALARVLCGPAPSLKNGIMYSSPVTGDILTSASRIYSPEHWVRNMVQPVEFLDSLTNMCFASSSNTTENERQQVDMILEIGPHAALQGPIRQILSQPQLKAKEIPYMSCLRRGQGAVDTMQAMACGLLRSGYLINLGAVNFPRGSEQAKVLTDLPSYPWNHEMSHWAEPRTNTTLRNRKRPVHDLLGTPTLDSTPFARKWRHVIRPSEMPWVRDHQVQSNSVYPGAGYISMAIEGCRQAHEDSGNSGLAIARYELRRVEIVKALIIPETTNGVEIQLCLQPCGNGVLDSRWHQFQILSVNQNDNWSLQCEGQIMAVLAVTEPCVESIGEEQPKIIHNNNSLSCSTARGRASNAEVQSLYKSLRDVGLNHGPIFQNITSIAKDGIKDGISRSSCSFVIADSASTMPYNFQQKHVLHPTTLDSILQAAYTALPPLSRGKEHPAMLPRSIESLSVAANVATRAATTLFVKSSVTKLSVQGFKSKGTISLEGSAAPVIEMQGLFCQALGTSSATNVDGEQARLCFTSVWKPDISFLNTHGIHQLQATLAGATYNGHGGSNGTIHPTKNMSNGTNGVVKYNSLEATIAVILKHLLHKKPRAHLLEIQATSGDLTEICLKALAAFMPDVRTSPGFLRYTWTDRAAECIEAARVRFAEYNALFTFRDHIADDIAEGNFNSDTDLILMPLAAVKANSSLLHHVVRPGGLVLAINNQTSTDEDFDAARTRFGDDFNTIELDVSSATLVVAIKKDDPTAVWQPVDVLVIQTNHGPSKEWLDPLSNGLARASTNNDSVVEIRDLDDIVQNSKLACNRTVLVLDDGAQSVLCRPSAEQFEVIKSVLVQAKDVLWVSRGGAVGSEQPEASLAVGLLRTLRCEYPDKRYICLDLASDASSDVSEADVVLKILAATIGQAADAENDDTIDTEYAVRNGLIHVARVSNDELSNSLLDDSLQLYEDIPFFSEDRNIRLGVDKPGLLDSLIFVDDDTVAGEIGPDQVQIKPAAFGLNFRDVMVAMGQLDETRMGFECSGTVVAIGSEAATARGLEVGDRVFAFLRGYFANTIRVHHTSVARVPEGMDMETAASIPLVFITAYHALHNMAWLKRGETILIHSGTGGVGQAAIMLAQLVKAEVFVTVGTQEKREFVAAKYGIPEDHIFNSRDASFASDIMRATNGKGVDVVLNSLAGTLLAATWSCIAPFGRFIEIGKRDLEQNSSLEMAPFVRSVTFASLDLITLGELRGDIVADVFVQINALLRAGCITAIAPVTSFSISNAGKAFRTMQTGKHMGKIVLVPHKKDMVKAVSRSRALHLLPDRTYMIVGGLGGIGRSIATWMVSRGAKNLVLLSRNTSSLSSDTLQWLQDLRESNDTTIRVEKCDVADESQLASSLAAIKTDLPPVKGIIHGGMVLRDVLFENMTLDEYQAATSVKVRGSMNLHNLLPPSLDFFIMLSSISGVGGNATQANYAAGGVFQDALAHHRTSQGQAAVSLDLGMVKGIGVLAATEGKDQNKTAARLERIGLRALDETQVLRLVELAMRGGSAARSQIITGMPPSWIRADAESNKLGSIVPFWQSDARFLPLEVSASQSGQEGNTKSRSSVGNLVGVLGDANVSDDEISAALSAALVAKLATMFMVPEANIDDAAPLARLGVDSLISVELRNWITAVVRAECSVFDIMQAASLAGLAKTLAEKSTLRPKKNRSEA